MRTAISWKFPVSIPRDLSPGPENGQVSSPDKILPIFAPLTIPSPQGPLMEKEGTGNVYLDGQVMGSNPGEKYRSYGKRPKSQNQLLGVYNYLITDLGIWDVSHRTDIFSQDSTPLPGHPSRHYWCPPFPSGDPGEMVS